MKIQLHELLTRLLPDTVVRIERDNVILIENEVANINDLLGYHHNLVKDLYPNMLNTLIITIE